jgi:hypothetical protein
VRIATLLFVGWALAHADASAASQGTQSRQVVVVIVGAAGTPEYAAQFAAWTSLWEQACTKSNAAFVSVGRDEPGTTSDHEHIRKILTELEAENGGPQAEDSEQKPKPSSALWLVLIGHGTFDGRTAKFNLRGPDLAANDLAEWLKPLHRPIAVIDTASSSAPFLKELSAPDRVIITATKSGFEQNYTRFGQYLAEAIIDPGADLDKDGQTSLLEAFLSASHAVAQFYAGAGRLATEHALLDDNGDGLGTPAEWFRGIRPVQTARDGAALDSYRAHQLHLLPSPTEAALPPEVRANRDQLELQVVNLRDTRAKLSDDEYFAQLEPLLCEIARIYEQMDQSGSFHK